MEEPMDINTLDTDFDNKENTIHHNNVLPRTPCTEKGYEELDVSELNMKLRYSNTPASSPMSRSYNFNCTENKSVKGDNPNIPVIELSHMTRSLNTTVSLNDTLKSTNALPLQALSTDPSGDYNKSVLQLLGPKCIDNVTNTVDTVQDDENLSFPSTSSSLAQTPDATTPTKEISKEDGGSPIMRGLKSVFSMFRPSQSPITSTEAKPQNEIILPDAQTQKLLASTPISSKKYKESTSRKSPHKESITFTDDLEKELQWNDETTIIFSHEKIPIHKLFPEEKLFKLTENNKVVLDDTVEFMDVSYYNDSLGDKTITNNQSIKNLNNSEMVLGDSDSEFVDCETTFTKDHSLLDVKKSIHVNNENTVANELTTNANKSEINEVAVHLDKIDVTLNNENVTNNHETNHDEFINNNANKTQEGNTNKYCVAGQSEVEKIVNKLDLNISNSTIKVPENDDIQMMSTNIIADTNDNKHQVDTKLECTEDNTAKTKVSDETINLDMTMNFNNYTMPIDKNSTIDILTSIENITEKSEECNSINNTKNNSYLTEHIKTENRFEETLPNDIPLPDETDTTEKSRPNSPLIYEFDVTIEANEVKSLDIPTKQCDITDENLNQNDTITEPETNSVVVSEVHDVITTYLPERNKEQNETHDLSINHSNVSEEEITICSDMQNDIIVAEKEVECQNQEMPKVNILQETEIFKLDQDKLSNPCENVSNIQTNILETTIVLNDLSNDERPHQNVIDENQTEVQTINFVSENMNAANEVIDNEEEVIISENNSPYVSLSAAIYEPNCQLKLKEHTSTVETPCNLELKVAEIPPSSPKIISRGNYNFNFDEMDDPFNSKTKIRSSMSPEKVNLSMNVAETVNKSQEIEVKVLDKDKRKSQHLKRKSGNHNITNTELNSSKIDNCYKKLNEISEMGKQEQQFNISVDNFNNNEKISELSKPDIMQENAPPVIDNVISLEVVEEHNDIITEANTSSETKVSLSENQNTDYVAPLASTEYVLSKNVFNIPEIGDSGFNPFATISKMQHSPDKSTNITVETESKEVADESHEELNCSSSSKFADGKNVTVREIDTEDEDTIEGPFLDTDELNNIDKMSDFDSEKVDMIQFSNVNQNGMEENDEGEMFIDAEAFEFLLNQNKAMVADSGKESLFLKFDPLFAKRMSSIQMQGKQSILQKPVKQSSSESTVMDISSIPGPSNVMDMSYEITNDVTYEDKCDETIINTITKPTMAVTPAVNSAVSPRNKTITPTRPNRRSFTFTSPAIAVIDRLLSMSANNSILAQDTSLVHVSNEQHEAELALTQLRELLAEKEISVHQLKCESNELKYRLETLESQMKRLEEESQQRLQHINSLNEKLAEKTRDNKNMAVVVEEYERTIASLIAEKEEEKRLREEERMKLIRERDEQTAHLANMECSFNDLHSKYEKSKGIILSYKANEDVYRKNIQDFENNFAKVQNNYDLLKQHATSKLNHANQELEKINRAHEADILKLHTMLKRKEVEITSLEESLAQKTKANDELAAICDELINKTGTSTEAGPLRGVAMATSDKHCQTTVKREQAIEVRNLVRDNVPGMFDESVPVVNAREIESPPSSGEEEEVLKAAMSKFNPPVRHTARHDFDSESDSDSEPEKFLDNLSGEDQSPDRKTSEKSFELQKPTTRESRTKPQQKRDISSNSESDSADLEPERVEPLAGSGRRRGGAGVVVPAEGAYDPKQFQDLKVPPEMENIFQYIMKYTPQKIDIDLKLQPFVPDYVPAVGDIDAFVKVNAPACNVTGEQLDDALLQHIDNLGLSILDEPSSDQSDSALLHLQLRALSKITSNKTTVLAKKVENAEKNPKAIDRWIKDVSELHLSKPPPTVNYTNKMPDIDSLMEEWPESMEEALNQEGVPPSTIDCSLQQYVELTCGLFDVPIHGDTLNDKIQALHLLFSLYSAVRNSQLYAERQKDKIEEASN